MSDRVLGLFAVFAGLAYAFAATRIPTSFLSDPVGSKTFPMMLGGLAALCGVLIALKPDSPGPVWPGIRPVSDSRSGCTRCFAFCLGLAWLHYPRGGLPDGDAFTAGRRVCRRAQSFYPDARCSRVHHRHHGRCPARAWTFQRRGHPDTAGFQLWPRRNRSADPDDQRVLRCDVRGAHQFDPVEYPGGRTCIDDHARWLSHGQGRACLGCARTFGCGLVCGCVSGHNRTYVACPHACPGGFPVRPCRVLCTISARLLDARGHRLKQPAQGRPCRMHRPGNRHDRARQFQAWPPRKPATMPQPAARWCRC